MRNQRIVVKVGTNVLQRPNGKLDYNIISELGEQIAAVSAQGYEVVLVSSGAVGAGREIHSFPSQKDPLIRKQMMAAVGQVRLMQIYSSFLFEHRIVIAQVLLTRSDFGNRSSYLNIRNSLEGLLKAKILPIINENDVVATEELALQFGDNDQLAVHVAALIGADAVFFLTTGAGFFRPAQTEGNLPAQLIEEVREINEEVLSYCQTSTSSAGTGGMLSKVKSAGLCMAFGMEAYIVSGKERNVLGRILSGEKLGTHFLAKPQKIPSYRKWLAAGALSRGRIIVDAGAEQALRNHKSLLSAGIVAVEGQFEAKDFVEIQGPAGTRLGVGRVNRNSAELREQLQTRQVPGSPANPSRAVVHRNHLVLF